MIAYSSGRALVRGEELLQFAALREVAGAEAVGRGDFAEVGEPVGIGIFVDAIDGGRVAVLEFPGHDFIRREHAFLDELVGNVVLHLLQPRGAALVIEPHFHLGKIEIERAGGEAVLAQQRGQFPRDLHALAQLGRDVERHGRGGEMHLAAALVVRRRRHGLVFEDGEGLPVGEPRGAADDAAREASRRGLAPLRSKSMKADMVSRSTPGLSEQMPLLSRSGSIGMTRSAR